MVRFALLLLAVVVPDSFLVSLTAKVTPSLTRQVAEVGRIMHLIFVWFRDELLVFFHDGGQLLHSRLLGKTVRRLSVLIQIVELIVALHILEVFWVFIVDSFVEFHIVVDLSFEIVELRLLLFAKVHVLLNLLEVN